MARTEAEMLRLLADPGFGDERVRRRARDDAELSIEERLQLVAEMSRQAHEFLAQLPPDVRARAEAYREPLDAVARAGLRRRAGLGEP